MKDSAIASGKVIDLGAARKRRVLARDRTSYLASQAPTIDAAKSEDIWNQLLGEADRLMAVRQSRIVGSVEEQNENRGGVAAKPALRLVSGMIEG